MTHEVLYQIEIKALAWYEECGVQMVSGACLLISSRLTLQLGCCQSSLLLDLLYRHSHSICHVTSEQPSMHCQAQMPCRLPLHGTLESMHASACICLMMVSLS